MGKSGEWCQSSLAPIPAKSCPPVPRIARWPQSPAVLNSLCHQPRLYWQPSCSSLVRESLQYCGSETGVHSAQKRNDTDQVPLLPSMTLPLPRLANIITKSLQTRSSISSSLKRIDPRVSHSVADSLSPYPFQFRSASSSTFPSCFPFSFARFCDQDLSTHRPLVINSPLPLLPPRPSCSHPTFLRL